jgi:hypothetical protein
MFQYKKKRNLRENFIKIDKESNQVNPTTKAISFKYKPRLNKLKYHTCFGGMRYCESTEFGVISYPLTNTCTKKRNRKKYLSQKE